MIYFIQETDSCNIKIGHSRNEAETRVAALQTGNSSELIILGTCDGDVYREGELHNRFTHAHVRGEWFRPVPELLNFIIWECAGPEIPFGRPDTPAPVTKKRKLCGHCLSGNPHADTRLCFTPETIKELAKQHDRYMAKLHSPDIPVTTVAKETERRGNCRYGLSGVTVFFSGEERVVRHTYWVADQKLIIAFEGEDRAPAEECYLRTRWACSNCRNVWPPERKAM